MIVDASVAVALSLDEPTVGWIDETLQSYPDEPLRISWVNIAETEIAVARHYGFGRNPMEDFLSRFAIETLEADFAVTRLVAEARLRFPINFGDCFAYAHARLRGEPLITLDADFLKTDLPRILHPDAQ